MLGDSAKPSRRKKALRKEKMVCFNSALGYTKLLKFPGDERVRWHVHFIEEQSCVMSLAGKETE